MGRKRGRQKYRVVSVRFRMDGEDADALAVLEAYEKEGYTTKQVVRAALLKLNGIPMMHEKEAARLQRLEDLVYELGDVITQAKELGINLPPARPRSSRKKPPSGFLNSIRSGMGVVDVDDE